MSMTATWPDRSYSSVPSAHEAVSLAASVRHAVSAANTLPLNLAHVCRVGGFEAQLISFNDVLPDDGVLPTDQTSARSLEALLVPTTGHRFTIYVNAEVAGSDFTNAATTARRRGRFRLAHEIGHSFFYDRRADIPVRSTAASSGEERFCDLFASLLLVPPSEVPQDPTPYDLRAMSGRYDVSLEVAARAVADSAAGRRGVKQLSAVEVLACEHESAIGPGQSRLHTRGSYPAARAATWPVTVVSLTRRPNPRTGRDVGWRTDWSAGAYVPRNARFAASAVAKAEEDGYGAGVEHVELGHLRGCYRLNALQITTGQRMLVTVRLVTTVGRRLDS